ncbi:hypothetical protein MLD38_019208 [Melastoma candidum]|uniref:Uncharacterized protein n=1 Tax=Melastoma candidum TaxID=119954 RepID=A0ACB9QXD4_9MYRT|nr:hypothetical protein MLD38_019208 [Melastoma candidum]
MPRSKPPMTSGLSSPQSSLADLPDPVATGAHVFPTSQIQRFGNSGGLPDYRSLVFILGFLQTPCTSSTPSPGGTAATSASLRSGFGYQRVSIQDPCPKLGEGDSEPTSFRWSQIWSLKPQHTAYSRTVSDSRLSVEGSSPWS